MRIMLHVAPLFALIEYVCLRLPLAPVLTGNGVMGNVPVDVTVVIKLNRSGADDVKHTLMFVPIQMPAGMLWTTKSELTGSVPPI